MHVMMNMSCDPERHPAARWPVAAGDDFAGQLPVCCLSNYANNYVNRFCVLSGLSPFIDVRGPSLFPVSIRRFLVLVLLCLISIGLWRIPRLPVSLATASWINACPARIVCLVPVLAGDIACSAVSATTHLGEYAGEA